MLVPLLQMAVLSVIICLPCVGMLVQTCSLCSVPVLVAMVSHVNQSQQMRVRYRYLDWLAPISKPKERRRQSRFPVNLNRQGIYRRYCPKAQLGRAIGRLVLCGIA
jgi:hypothetical protein